MNSSHAATFRDWVPIRFYRRGSEPYVDWCYMGSDRFTNPFFADTIRQRMRQPFNVLFRHQTRIEFLRELTEVDAVIPPTGFIFHMSRCGSTLVAQMLASLSRNIVVSEAPPIDAILRLRTEGLADGTVSDWLTWMIHALGRRRIEAEKDFFIKFDSWNTLELEFIRQVFPDVPWIFLYRLPLEVIVSHMRQRGSQMIPGAMGALLPELDLAKALRMPAEEYCAKLLAKICAGALSFADDDNGLLVNYDQLPGAVTGVIAEHFGLSFSDEEMETLNGAARYNAKTPQMFFEPDTAGKREEATDAARQAAATWTDPVYAEMEAFRSNDPQ